MSVKQLTIFNVLGEEYNKLESYLPKKTDNYEDFIAKFDIPKTTDDCYTPPEIYDVVVQFCSYEFTRVIAGKNIHRPFYPNGNYLAEMQSYTDDDVVIDNPPFSILAKIVRNYMAAGVKFFLFAPGLTVFNLLRVKGVAVVLGNNKIVYANGAVVKTAFVTNMQPSGIRVMLRESLGVAIKAAQGNKKSKRVLQVFDKHLFNSTRLEKFRIDMDICDNECVYNPNWAFGGGLLLSDNAVEMIAERVEREERVERVERVERPLTEEQKLCLDALNSGRII